MKQYFCDDCGQKLDPNRSAVYGTCSLSDDIIVQHYFEWGVSEGSDSAKAANSDEIAWMDQFFEVCIDCLEARIKGWFAKVRAFYPGPLQSPAGLTNQNSSAQGENENA